MKPLRVLSLFDGISCLRVALADKPVIYYASEIDTGAIKISKKNYPDIIHLGSVCDISGLTNIDLLCGGSPCTDLSIAKRDRKGLEGERSKLFYEYVRIWKECKPMWFILENVASMPEKDKQIITSILGVEPILINAALVSAQSRKRLFWTNIPVKELPDDRNIVLSDIMDPIVDESYYVKQSLYTAVKRKSEDFKQVGFFGAKNSCNVGGQALRIYDANFKSPTLSTTGSSLIQLGYISNSNSQANRVYSTNGKSVTLSALAGGGGGKTGLYKVGSDDIIIRKLTPVECERLQGLPDNYTDGISNSARYKVLGNAFNVDVIKHILSFIPKPQD